MTTRYSRRLADGTFEHHNSRASLDAARERESETDRAGLFGLIGVLVGGVLSYFFVHKWGVDWPKWLKFASVFVAAGVSYHVLSKLANWIWDGIRLLFLIGIVYGLGLLIWQAL
jgi:hypothetical protein